MQLAFLSKFASAAALIVPLYIISASDAPASEWGCQVLLCLSNPGGPTEFSECRPPMERLWSHLANWQPFPTCSGAIFSATTPKYERYFCDEGFRPISRDGRGGEVEVGCVSFERHEVDPVFCEEENVHGEVQANLSTGWERVGGQYVCKALVTKRPNIRSQPRYIDVTIDGVGAQRVWF